jgi:hypothetical protein
LVRCVVVVALGGSVLDRPVHLLNQSVGPRMVQLAGKP